MNQYLKTEDLIRETQQIAESIAGIQTIDIKQPITVEKLNSIIEKLQDIVFEIELQNVLKKYIRFFHDESTDRHIFQGSFNGSVWFELIQGTNAYKEFFETKNGHRYVITTESKS